MKTSRERYETLLYTQPNQFSFGKNWRGFLNTSFTPERVEDAKKSLVTFLGNSNAIVGKTFIDIGSGSGLFSLAAYRLGAAEIVSIDVDEVSITCTRRLKEMAGNPPHWKVIRGSVLNEAFIRSLGQFDTVYSWGVLHHTGDMYQAFANIAYLLKERGVLYLAIYNRGRIPWSGTSEFWLRVKRLYSNSGAVLKNAIFVLYLMYFFLNSLVTAKNPFHALKKGNRRGMDWYHNVIDWLGGYPYEFASPDEIVNYFAPKNIYCEKIANGFGLGCAEYRLRYLPHHEGLPGK